jgi:hypothetical protein
MEARPLKAVAWCRAHMYTKLVTVERLRENRITTGGSSCHVPYLNLFLAGLSY